MANKVVETRTAIAANITELDVVLLDAMAGSAEARELIQAGNADGAIGALANMERALDDAKALYRAALVLHRKARR